MKADCPFPRRLPLLPEHLVLSAGSEEHPPRRVGRPEPFVVSRAAAPARRALDHSQGLQQEWQLDGVLPGLSEQPRPDGLVPVEGLPAGLLRAAEEQLRLGEHRQ